MNKKCMGCGAILQCDDPKKEGFINSDIKEKAFICQRCFRIKNYGDYQIIEKDKNSYQEIFNLIKIKKDLTLFLCDIFNLDDSIKIINEFNKNVVLVITKKDLLPKSVKETKLLDYIKKHYNLNVISILFVSAIKNYNLDLLMNLIKKYKNSNRVYLVGNTNAGKSTLINQMIKSYSDNNAFVTTSMLPATTLDIIEIKLNDDITLIDTPGLIVDGNYLNDEEGSLVKKLTPKSEIKPRTYQMKPKQSLLIENYARVDYLSNQNNSFTIYLSNDIKVDRININTNNNLRNLDVHEFKLEAGKDIVISGLCFIKIVKSAEVKIYVKKGVKVFVRDNLI